MTQNLMAELLDEIRLPEGTFNLVNADPIIGYIDRGVQGGMR